MTPPTLLAVPNVSEGRDGETIAAIARAFAGAGPSAASSAGAAVRLLDVHTDSDHHRTVYTLAGPPRALTDALLRGAREAVERIDVLARAGGTPEERGQHPYVGAVDVAPIVYRDPRDRGAACAEALVLADRLGEELALPVFLYGELSGADAQSQRTRAQLRRGGVRGLSSRMRADDPAGHADGRGGGEAADAGAESTAGRATGAPALVPDFGPARMHPSAGATLVAARPPLVAFNLQLAPPAGLEDARAIAALIRDGGAEGLPGVRAIGVALAGRGAQVSTNVERPDEISLARVVRAVRAHAPVASAELVGLAPAAAFAEFPPDVPIPGFDAARHVLENALGC